MALLDAARALLRAIDAKDAELIATCAADLRQAIVVLGHEQDRPAPLSIGGVDETRPVSGACEAFGNAQPAGEARICNACGADPDADDILSTGVIN